LRELNSAWRNSYLSDNDEKMPDRKTWYNRFNEIYDITGIEIQADKGKSLWFIKNRHALHSQEIMKWMLAAASYRNMLEECFQLNERVDLDGFPSENNRLMSIVSAMKSSTKLLVSYGKYGDDSINEHDVAPYFIKSYKKRLYLVGKKDTGKFLPLSFDRIRGIAPTDEKFVFPKDLTAKEFFFYSYGVMLPKKGMKVERIIVRAWGDTKYYLRDVPLHHTQIELKATEEYADFEITIYPTNDFIGDVAQQQYRMEIRYPQWLRDQMKESLERTRRLYD